MNGAIENLAITIYITLRVCELLRHRGVSVGVQQVLVCLEAITQYRSLDKERLVAIYRVTLVNRRQDFATLHVALEDVLRGCLNPQPERVEDSTQQLVSRRSRRQFSDDEIATLLDAEPSSMQGYSTQEVDHHKDLRFVSKLDGQAFLLELRKIARREASTARRRLRNANKARGRLDMRASMRQAVRLDGEVLKWKFKGKTPTKLRCLVIADVSGSMEVYSIFLLNFLHHLNSSRHMKVETFVFSTRVERLTREFSGRKFREVLRKITDGFSGWSGGTRIGAAIKEINDTYGLMVTPKTTVLIMSDGWDTGDTALLDQEMATLKRRANAVIWINPLKGATDYQPLALGMATALPHCDRFVAGHSLDSMERLAELLRN